MATAVHLRADEPLLEVLRRAQRLGFVGPRPIVEQVGHGEAFASATALGWARSAPHHGSAPPTRVIDLGSGGGLPGLVIARCWPAVFVALVEAQERRARHLERSVARLGLGDRVTVVRERAEVVGRDPEHRGSYQAVTARAFGPPAVTAECAAPLLEVGGVLVVSEPPQPTEGRWSDSGLAELGMGPARVSDVPPRFAAVLQLRTCPPRYPRRVGVPTKRPLF